MRPNPLRPSVRAAVVALSVLAGCSSARPAPIQVGPGRTDLTAPAGTRLEVEAGPENQSVGDQWQLGSVTPTGALVEIDKRWRDKPPCPPQTTGCGEGVAYFAVRLGPDLLTGTVVRFTVQNCFRGTCPSIGAPAADAGDQVRYVVTIGA